MDCARFAFGLQNEDIFNPDTSWERFRIDLEHKRRKQKLRNTFRYVILLLLIISLAWYVYSLLIPYQNNKEPIDYVELIAPRGETAIIKLADRINIQLNAGSSIRIPTEFDKRKSHVYLTGEAFFKVSGNKKQPIVVNAGELEIKVFGTSFNVKSYPDENLVETTIVEGNVEVFKSNKPDKFNLGKNQFLIYDKKSDTFYLKKDVPTTFYTSWTEGYYKFSGIQLNSLIKNIERLYDVDVRIENQKLKDLTFTGSFNKEESIPKVLEMIELSSNDVQINHIGNKTFSITNKNQCL
ncbi:FecR family protein [Bacteroidota bacterium]